MVYFWNVELEQILANICFSAIHTLLSAIIVRRNVCSLLNQIFAVCDCDLVSGYFRKARFYCIYLRGIDLSNSNNFCRRSFLYQQEWIVIKLYAIAGSFEESVLNGRLEPVSTVHGFTADLGASGSFCPAHLVLPVTVFFYTLGDNDKVSSPYLVSARIILIFG